MILSHRHKSLCAGGGSDGDGWDVIETSATEQHHFCFIEDNRVHVVSTPDAK